jgi:dienelactone hydrolase
MITYTPSLFARHVALCAAAATLALLTASVAPAEPTPAEQKIEQPINTEAKDLVEERSFITIRLSGKAYHLEMLVVKPARAEGKLSVAMIAHGKPKDFQMPLMRPELYLPQARDLAYRGYLTAVVSRRGYGRSDGLPGMASLTPYASCEKPDLTKAFDAEADDLEQVLKVIAERPDADGSRMIAIGESVGGASVLALAARQPQGLVGVVNISGGVQNYGPSGKCLGREAMVPAMTAFGASTKVPTLWVYAENDSLFSPDLVSDMRDAFAEAGARVKLKMVPPLQIDGHAMFGDANGRVAWLIALDSFLHAEGLPTWDYKQAMAAAKAASGDKPNVDFAAQYMSVFTPKALVIDPGRGVMTWSANTNSLAAAREKALADCKSKGGVKCTVLMENFAMKSDQAKTASIETPATK